MDAHDVGASEELVLRDRLGRGLGRARGAEVRAPCDHVHPEGVRDRHHRRADPPEADEAERLLVQLGAERVLPPAGADPRVLGRDRAHQRKDQRPGELDGVTRAPPRPAHDDATASGGVEVDRGVAHAGRHQQAQVGQPFEARGVETRALAHRDDDLGAGERRDQGVVAVERLVERLHVAAAPQVLPRARRERDPLVVVEDHDADRLAHGGSR